MDTVYSFYPFLHWCLFLCTFKLSLFHVTNIMVLYIASPSSFLFSLNNTSYLMCLPACFCFAVEMEAVARRKENIIRSLMD